MSLHREPPRRRQCSTTPCMRCQLRRFLDIGRHGAALGRKESVHQPASLVAGSSSVLLSFQGRSSSGLLATHHVHSQGCLAQVGFQVCANFGVTHAHQTTTNHHPNDHGHHHGHGHPTRTSCHCTSLDPTKTSLQTAGRWWRWAWNGFNVAAGYFSSSKTKRQSQRQPQTKTACKIRPAVLFISPLVLCCFLGAFFVFFFCSCSNGWMAKEWRTQSMWAGAENQSGRQIPKRGVQITKHAWNTLK